MLNRKTRVGIKILLRVVKWRATEFLCERFATDRFSVVFSLKPTKHVQRGSTKNPSLCIKTQSYAITE